MAAAPGCCIARFTRGRRPASEHVAAAESGAPPGESKRQRGLGWGILRNLAQAAGAGLDWGMLRNAGFLSLFLIAFIYNGVAFSLLGWVALFMQDVAGLSTFQSISTVSVFYVALTLGRFICAAYAERLGYAATLLVLTAILILTYPLVVFSTGPNPLGDRHLPQRAQPVRPLSHRPGLRLAPLPTTQRAP